MARLFVRRVRCFPGREPAERLQALYVDELRQSLVPPVGSMVNRRQTEALIRRARTIGPAAYTEPDATTWIWSDLHLGHEHSRSVFGRPFPTAAAADEAMMNAWYEEVAAGETIICLGDVTVDGEALPHHQEWWRKAPGTKWLVLGNHDVDPVNRIRPFEIDRTAVTLYAAGDPPLVLTHVPLVQVPHGMVNVHGHVHEQESPTPNPARQRQRRAAELPPCEAERHPAIGATADGRTDRSRAQHSGAAERRGTRHAVTGQAPAQPVAGSDRGDWRRGVRCTPWRAVLAVDLGVPDVPRRPRVSGAAGLGFDPDSSPSVVCRPWCDLDGVLKRHFGVDGEANLGAASPTPVYRQRSPSSASDSTVGDVDVTPSFTPRRFPSSVGAL